VEASLLVELVVVESIGFQPLDKAGLTADPRDFLPEPREPNSSFDNKWPTFGNFVSRILPDASKATVAGVIVALASLPVVPVVPPPEFT
jgi:hypothetical protein